MTAPTRQRRQSAGILLYRFPPGSAVPEVLLGHMGGPMWQRRDVGAWSIPKGGFTDGEDAFAAARREFEEEVGVPVPAEHFVDLGEVQQAGGKYVRAWAAEGDLDPGTATQQHLRGGVAAGLGPPAGVPGVRPGRLVRARGGDVEDRRGAGELRGAAAPTAHLTRAVR